MIPFYVQARKIAIQAIFGDGSADKNISLEHLYVSADKIAVIWLRIFEIYNFWSWEQSWNNCKKFGLSKLNSCKKFWSILAL